LKYLIMVSHGELAPGLKTACEMMTGPKPEVLCTNLLDGMSTTTYADNFRKLLEPIDFNNDELILMADIIGGSPFTTAIEILSEKGVLDKCTILSGMNLPMAVTAVIMKDVLPKEDFVQTVITEGQGAITEFTTAVDNSNDDF